MKNRKDLTQKCDEAIERYREEQRKFDEFLSQIVSLESIKPGKEIRPKRSFDVVVLKKAEQKLDKARQEMDEACKRLYEAYH